MSDVAKTISRSESIEALPDARVDVRHRYRQLMLGLCVYFIVSTTTLLLLGAIDVNVWRLLFYCLLFGGLWSVIPKVDRRALFPETQVDFAGIWPENWTSRRELRASLISGLVLGGVVAWFLLEAVLMGSEARRTTTSYGLVELLVGLDLIVIWCSILLAFWLWWEPFINRDAVLMVTPHGMNVLGYPEHRVPERIEWTDIKKVRVETTVPPMLYLWYRPLRQVLGIQLPQLTPDEHQHLSDLLNAMITPNQLDAEAAKTRAVASQIDGARSDILSPPNETESR